MLLDGAIQSIKHCVSRTLARRPSIQRDRGGTQVVASNVGLALNALLPLGASPLERGRAGDGLRQERGLAAHRLKGMCSIGELAPGRLNLDQAGLTVQARL